MPVRVNLKPLDTMSALPYLGRMVVFNNSDWADLYGNLSKAQRRWGMVEKVLKNTGELVRSQVMLYKLVVQMVLLYRSNNCGVMEAMHKLLEGFHHQVAQRIAEMLAWQLN